MDSLLFLFDSLLLPGDLLKNSSIIGIDLGTTNSLVAVWQNGSARIIPNSLGKNLTRGPQQHLYGLVKFTISGHEHTMITAIRYFAWMILFTGAVSTLVASVSFIIDIPGLSLNDQRVDTVEEKLKLVGVSITFLLAAVIPLVFLKAKYLKRNGFILKIASVLENAPIHYNNATCSILAAVAGLSLLASLIAPNLNVRQHFLVVLAIPPAFGLGFIVSLLVLGFQAINPFCPEKVLRFFALITLSVSVLASILILPSTFSYPISDPAVFMAPDVSLGMATGACVVLRKWTEFKPAL